MHFAATEAEFEDLKVKFLTWAEAKHKPLADYFKKEWFSAKFGKMWGLRSLRGFRQYSNFIEAWHKLLKSVTLVNKHNRRIDKLFMF